MDESADYSTLAGGTNSRRPRPNSSGMSAMFCVLFLFNPLDRVDMYVMFIIFLAFSWSLHCFSALTLLGARQVMIGPV